MPTHWFIPKLGQFRITESVDAYTRLRQLSFGHKSINTTYFWFGTTAFLASPYLPWLQLMATQRFGTITRLLDRCTCPSVPCAIRKVPALAREREIVVCKSGWDGNRPVIVGERVKRDECTYGCAENA
ncbi:hypothetical protein PIIN_04889 [Serendipita indica DSM 11827]|uniref:Uncharacterized protein n=1 Tax=Serendipita indica (strain DSM 11827) TaxID=1109443 RepID=G4TI00_SERID|nr:hypothetical protein PIIN_04889 [Serendipita indica DSM 11827]